MDKWEFKKYLPKDWRRFWIIRVPLDLTANMGGMYPELCKCQTPFRHWIDDVMNQIVFVVDKWSDLQLLAVFLDDYFENMLITDEKDNEVNLAYFWDEINHQRESLREKFKDAQKTWIEKNRKQ